MAAIAIGMGAITGFISHNHSGENEMPMTRPFVTIAAFSLFGTVVPGLTFAQAIPKAVRGAAKTVRKTSNKTEKQVFGPGDKKIDESLKDCAAIIAAGSSAVNKRAMLTNLALSHADELGIRLEDKKAKIKVLLSDKGGKFLKLKRTKGTFTVVLDIEKVDSKKKTVIGKLVSAR